MSIKFETCVMYENFFMGIDRDPHHVGDFLYYSNSRLSPRALAKVFLDFIHGQEAIKPANLCDIMGMNEDDDTLFLFKSFSDLEFYLAGK